MKRIYIAPLAAFLLGILAFSDGFATEPAKDLAPEKGARTEVDRPKTAEEVRKEECAELRAGLPTKDPYFELKGKVRFENEAGNTTTREILQFGRHDKYFQYEVIGSRCDRFGLYQIKSMKREGSSNNITTIRYNVTLKNNKTIIAYSRPFCWFDPEMPGFCSVLSSQDNFRDKERNLYFRYLFTDPSFRKPVEALLDHTKIIELEVY